MFLAIDEISRAIKERLEALRKAKEDEDSGSVQRFSSEIVGQARLLLERFDDIKTAGMSLDEEKGLLSKRKDAAFLLIGCFGIVTSRGRKDLGSGIQQLLVVIYDSANEGVHYTGKDEVFMLYRKIIYDAISHAFAVFREAELPVSFYTDCFMPWINGIESPIRKAVKRYFRDEYRGFGMHAVANVEFTPKEGGVQIGTKATISFVDGAPSVIFYVKAHQNYSAASSERASSSRKCVDLKELLVYKVLEYIGLCSKVCFVMHQGEEDSPYKRNALFIATQNVSHTKHTAEKQKIFKSAGQMYSFDRDGSFLGDIPFSREFEAELAGADVTSIKLAATIIDVVARVFRLEDMNEGNFGRVTVTESGLVRHKWKLLDFVVSAIRPERYVIGDSDSTTEGFITGNGTLGYSGTMFLARALLKRVREEKIRIGCMAVEMLEAGLPSSNHPGRNKIPLGAAIIQAFTDIEKYMTEPLNGEGLTRATLLGVSREFAMDDLTAYHRAVLANFDNLKSGLRARAGGIAAAVEVREQKRPGTGNK